MSEGKTIAKLMEEMRAKAGELMVMSADSKVMECIIVTIDADETTNSIFSGKNELTVPVMDNCYEKALTHSQEKGRLILSHAKVLGTCTWGDCFQRIRYMRAVYVIFCGGWKIKVKRDSPAT